MPIRGILALFLSFLIKTRNIEAKSVMALRLAQISSQALLPLFLPRRSQSPAYQELRPLFLVRFCNFS
jgi:hypothetical protein